MVWSSCKIDIIRFAQITSHTLYTKSWKPYFSFCMGILTCTGSSLIYLILHIIKPKCFSDHDFGIVFIVVINKKFISYLSDKKTYRLLLHFSQIRWKDCHRSWIRDHEQERIQILFAIIPQFVQTLSSHALFTLCSRIWHHRPELLDKCGTLAQGIFFVGGHFID